MICNATSCSNSPCQVVVGYSASLNSRLKGSVLLPSLVKSFMPVLPLTSVIGRGLKCAMLNLQPHSTAMLQGSPVHHCSKARRLTVLSSTRVSNLDSPQRLKHIYTVEMERSIAIMLISHLKQNIPSTAPFLVSSNCIDISRVSS